VDCSQMELHFEILRKRTHIFCQSKDSVTPKELKKVIEGILKIGTDKQTLKKQMLNVLRLAPCLTRYQ